MWSRKIWKEKNNQLFSKSFSACTKQLQGIWIQLSFAGYSPCRTKQPLLFTSALVLMVQNLLASTRINLLHEISPDICLSSCSDICPDLLLFLHKQHFLSSMDEHLLYSTSTNQEILVGIWALIFTDTLASPFRTLLLLSFGCALQWLGDALSTSVPLNTIILCSQLQTKPVNILQEPIWL